MRLLRFDPEISMRADDPGSRYTVGPLVGDDARVRVEVLHLPADGSTGRRAASADRLVAVVAGDGWVSGDDGRYRPIAAGRAAQWDAGEEHELGSRGGLTAVAIEGTFDVWAMAVTREIVVADHDPAWAAWFGILHDRIWPAVADVALRIDHVGSTAVPGLAAKPIIDIDVVVATDDEIPPVIERLAALGYRWRGNLGVVGREAFEPASDDHGLPPHQLYLVVDGNKAHLDHVLLRDLLRADPVARARYADLKRRNVDRAGDDIDIYVAAKAPLVAELLTRAREEVGLPPAVYWAPELPDD